MELNLAGFTFRPGLYPTLAFVLLFPLLIWLGVWQLDRAQEKQLLVQTRAERQRDLPVDLNLVQHIDMDDRFRPAEVSGHFVPGRQWLQDNRLHEGQAGYHVYSLFQPIHTPGRWVLINRGWIAAGTSRQILPVLPLPDGVQHLAGHLDMPASVGLALGPVDYTASDMPVLPYLQIGNLGEAIGHELFAMALVLAPDQPGALIHDTVPVAQMGPEKHLGYAVQWFGLATALLMIYIGVNVRRTPTKEDCLS